MRIMITGSPGVGKTTVANALGKKLKCKVVNENEFAVGKGIGTWNVEEDELVVPLRTLEKALNKMLENEKKIIVEGHLLCEIKLKVDFVVLLRLHPELLEARLAMRGYKAEKVQNNVLCEGIDYCKKHALRKYPKKRIIEIYAGKNIKETIAQILSALKKTGGDYE